MTITECRERFGRAPRSVSMWDRLTYLRIPKPAWLRADKDDGLNTLFVHEETLLRQGTVVWGHVVQANSLLFEEGADDCPGEVVYSIEDDDRVDPEHLENVADQLYELKGTEPDEPDLRPIAEYLTDELIRVYGLDVPTSISPGVRCQISTTYFARKHLPRRRLCQSSLPLVVNPNTPRVVLPLPARYWPKALVDEWAGRARC